MSTIIGTTFLVHGQWYLRYAGGGGSMAPVNCSDGVKESLQDGQTVEISGYLDADARGCLRGVEATEVRALAGSERA